MRVALIIIFVIAAGVLITVIAAAEAISVAAAFMENDGSYLDSGYEIGTEATAWMPLPEPYKGGD